VSDGDADASLAISTRGLTKRFGKRAVVDALDLRVPRGSVYGFLGPNGSGKTTTIRMLLGLSAASAGEIRMLGEQMPGRAQSVLPRVGALVEGPAFYPYLSGRANLVRYDAADRHTVSATRRARVDAALDRVGLSHAATKHTTAYSLGMKQRLGIANALLQPRDILILDEPSNGLDPQGTREVRSLIRSLTDDGTTIFMSSHLLAEVEQLCTHVGVMSGGRLVAQGTLDELRAAGTPHITVRTPDPAAARAVLLALGLPDVPLTPGSAPASSLVSTPLAPAVSPERTAGQGDATRRDVTVVAELTVPGVRPEHVTEALVTAGVRVRGIAVVGATLEERFVALTGEGFDVAG
jgi:ABC-type multidrug transport system ATPase subunit